MSMPHSRERRLTSTVLKIVVRRRSLMRVFDRVVEKVRSDVGLAFASSSRVTDASVWAWLRVRIACPHRRRWMRLSVA
jgi:hypothetical protein